jgi:hypothetical protein
VTGLYLTIYKAGGGKLTHNPSKSEVAGPRLRPHVNLQQLINRMFLLILHGIYKNYSQTI